MSATVRVAPPASVKVMAEMSRGADPKCQAGPWPREIRATRSRSPTCWNAQRFCGGQSQLVHDSVAGAPGSGHCTASGGSMMSVKAASPDLCIDRVDERAGARQAPGQDAD